MKIMSAREAKETSEMFIQQKKQRALESLEEYIPREIGVAVAKGEKYIDFVLPSELDWSDCSHIISQLEQAGYAIKTTYSIAGTFTITIKWGDE